MSRPVQTIPSPWTALAAAAAVLALGGCGTDDSTTGKADTTSEDVEDAADTEDVILVPTVSATLQATPLTGNVPLAVEYTLTVQSDVPLTDFLYAWDFGDGDVFEADAQQDLGAALQQAHTYKYKGQFRTRVTVSWRKNLKVSRTATVDIEVVQPAALSLSTIAVTTPTDVGHGSEVKLAFEIRNDGAAVTGPFQTKVVLSADDVADANDAIAATIDHAGMPSGLQGTAVFAWPAEAPFAFKVPAGLPDGNYFVLVWVDPEGKVPEVNRMDNQGFASSLLTIDTKIIEPPDLTITAPAFDGTATVSAGANVTYTLELENVGKGEAKSFKFAVYLSKDQTLQVNPGAGKGQGDIDAHDILITDSANSSVKSLAAGIKFTIFRGLSVPALPDGSYYLIAKVDAEDKVAEADEANNTAASPNTLTIKQVIKEGVDLGLLSMVVKPKGTYLGGNIGVTWKAKNLGTMQTPKFPATIYFCPTSTLSKAQCVINQTKLEIAPLAVGEEKSEVTSITINTNTPVQDWYLFMLLDPDNAIAELDEGNNIQKWDKPPLKVTASAQVEIKPENVGFHPATAVAGSEIKVSHRVVNTGSTGSGATETWYVVSSVPEISAANVANGKNIVVKKVMDPGVEGLDSAQRADKIIIPEGLLHTLQQVWVGVILDGTKLEKNDNAGNNALGSATPLAISGTKGGCYDDAWDGAKGDNDAADKAVAVQPGTLAGLGSCGDDDWWAVTLNKGDSLVVQVLAQEILWTSPVAADLDLELVGPDGKALDIAKGLGLIKQVVALTVAQAGVYKVRVAPYTAGVQASYALTVQVTPPPAGIDLFPNALSVAPAAAYPGGLVKATGKIANLGATKAGPFQARFVLSTDAKIELSDTLLKIVTVAGVDAASSIDVVETLLLPMVAGGKYHVGLLVDTKDELTETNEGNNAALSNGINLNQQFSCANDSFAGNHTVDTAAALPAKAASYDKLNVCPGLPDWYQLDLPQGQALSVKVNWTVKPNAGLIGVQILDASGKGVVAGTANPFDPVAKIPYLQVGGTYYLHVYVLPVGGKPAEPYDYGLDVTIGAPDPGDVCLADVYESNNAATAAQELGCGLATMTLCVGDEDWFYLDLAKDEAIKIVFGHQGGGIEFAVYGDPKATPLQKVSTAGTIDFKAPADGTYYMRAYAKLAGAKPSGTFTYTLQVDGGKGVDLLPKIQSLFPNEVVQGEDAYLTSEISNECKDVAGAFHYGWFFSADATLDKDDVVVFEKKVAGLGAKAKLKLDDKVPLPVEAKPGPAWLILQADHKGEVAESQELNNHASQGLTVVKLCLPDALEPNNTPTFAKPLDIGTVPDLALCPFELDWYVVEAQAGETLTITATFAQDKGDLDLRLYEPGKFGTAIAAAATKQAPEQIVYKVAKSGKFYLRVGGFAGDSNVYALSLCRSDKGVCVDCPDDSYCSGGMFCAEGGVCKSLGCVVGDNATCDDGNQCTLDVCAAKQGCSHDGVSAIMTPCDDGNACTIGTICDAGAVCHVPTSDEHKLATGAPGTAGGGMVVVAPQQWLHAGSNTVPGGRAGFIESVQALDVAWHATITAAGYPAVHLAALATQTTMGSVGAVGWAGPLASEAAILPELPQGQSALFVRVHGETGAILHQQLFAGMDKVSALHDVAAVGSDWLTAGVTKAVASGDGQDALVMRVDGQGKILWQWVGGGSGSDVALRIRPLFAGAWLVAGSDGTATETKAWLARFSDDGKLAWTSSWSGGGTYAMFLDVRARADTSIVGFGASDAGGPSAGIAGIQPWQAVLVGAGATKPPSSQTATTWPADGGLGRGWIASAWENSDGSWLVCGAAHPDKGQNTGVSATIWRATAAGKATHVFQWAGQRAFQSVSKRFGVERAYGTAYAFFGPTSWIRAESLPEKLSCEDANPCTIDACDAKTGCSHKPAADGGPCAGGGVCKAGVCQ